jgi:basic amino acid/polyamine antiporter, APA family
MPTLTPRRSLGLWALVAFGVGDILGAGIYGLVGKISEEAGGWGVASILVAWVVAAFTALSYGELGGRFPRSGGEAHFCKQGFGRPWVPWSGSAVG